MKKLLTGILFVMSFAASLVMAGEKEELVLRNENLTLRMSIMQGSFKTLQDEYAKAQAELSDVQDKLIKMGISPKTGKPLTAAEKAEIEKAKAAVAEKEKKEGKKP